MRTKPPQYAYTRALQIARRYEEPVAIVFDPDPEPQDIAVPPVWILTRESDQPCPFAGYSHHSIVAVVEP